MIVNSVVYRNGKRLGEIALDDISDVLPDPGTFVWLGVRDPEAAQLRKVQEEFGLHELAIEDALVAHQRPKLELYGESLFMVLNTAQLIDGAVEFGETHLFVGRNFIVTVRHGPSSSYAQVREKCETRPGMLAKGPAYVAYAVLDFVVDHLNEVTMQIEQRFGELEKSIFNDVFDRAAIERLYDMKAQLVRVRSATAPLRDICGQLIRLHEQIVPKELRPYYRDVEDHVTHIIDTLDVIREMLTTAISVNLALVTVSQNEVVKRLAGWGAILAIPTVIFSLYGMNFKSMPELDFRYGYPAALLFTLGACAVMWRKLRAAGWV
jgi:magnesium transporter